MAKKKVDIGFAEMTLDEIVSQDVGQDPDTGDTVNTVNVKITATRVNGDKPMLGTSKCLEKLTKNKPVEYVMQWRETKVLIPK